MKHGIYRGINFIGKNAPLMNSTPQLVKIGQPLNWEYLGKQKRNLKNLYVRKVKDLEVCKLVNMLDSGILNEEVVLEALRNVAVNK